MGVSTGQSADEVRLRRTSGPPLTGAWAWAVSALLVAGALAASRLHGEDLMVYRAGARVFAEHPADLYARVLPLDDGRALPFTYPPFAAFAMLPLAFLPQWAATVVNAGAGLALLWLVCRDFAPRLAAVLPERVRPWCTAPLLLGVLCWTAPFRDSFNFGQINIIVFGLVYLACTRLGLGFLAGVVLGLLGGVKLTPLALGLVPLAWGRWKMVLGIFTGFAGSLLLLMAVAPGLSKQYWLQVIRDPSRVGGIGYFDNISFEGVVARLLTDMKGVWFLGVLVIVALTLMALMGLRGRLDLPAQLGLGATAMLLISPISWTHHATWLPLMVYGWLCVGRVTGRLRWAFAVVSAMIVIVMGVGFRGIGWDSVPYDLFSVHPWAKIVACVPAALMLLGTCFAFSAVLTMRGRPGLFEVPRTLVPRTLLRRSRRPEPIPSSEISE